APLRHLRRDQHRQALRGRRHPRSRGRDLAVRCRAVHDLARSALGAARRAFLLARTGLRPQGRVGGGRALLVRDGRGIYGGFFTATEGAAMGAFGAMIFALWRRALTWKNLYAAVLERARTTATLL